MFYTHKNFEIWVENQHSIFFFNTSNGFFLKKYRTFYKKRK